MAVNLKFHSHFYLWYSVRCTIKISPFAKQTCKGKCTEYTPCVQCHAFQTGMYGANECEANCAQYNITLHETLAGKLQSIYLQSYRHY